MERHSKTPHGTARGAISWNFEGGEGILSLWNTSTDPSAQGGFSLKQMTGPNAHSDLLNIDARGFKVTNDATTGSMQVAGFFQPGLNTDGTFNHLSIGKAPGTNQSSTISYNRGADDSKSFMGLGLYGKSAAVTIHPSGKMVCNHGLDIRGNTFNLATTRNPTPGDGTAGDICYDASNLYICVASNTWKKIALAPHT